MQSLLPGWAITNYGEPSVQTQNRINIAPSYAASFGSNRSKNVAVLWEITNDLYNNEPVSATYAINRYVEWCGIWQNAGFKVVAVTVLPRTQANVYANFEQHRQDANSYIRANWATFADGLADVAADSRIGAPGASNDTTYYSVDKVHLNDTGYGVVSSIVAPSVMAV